MPTVKPKEIVRIGGRKYRAGDEYPEQTPKAQKAPEAKKADTRKDGK